MKPDVIFYRNGLMLVAALTLALRIFGDAAVDERAPITVAFRYDDFSALSDTELETRIIGHFEEARLPLTLAVIPFVVDGDSHDPAPKPYLSLPEEKVRLLRLAPNWSELDIALHGYSHQTNRPRSDGNYTEFRDLELADQVSLIRAGKEALEGLFGRRIATFVPPWESYDSSTLLALEQLDFDVVSAQGWALDERRDSSLKVIPSTCDLLDLERAVESARAAGDPQALIVVLFHPYDFFESGSRMARLTLSDLAERLVWLGAQQGVVTASLAEVSATMGAFSSARATRYDVLRRLQGLLPPASIRPRYYPSEGALGGYLVRGWALVAGFHLVVGLLASLASFRLVGLAAARRVAAGWLLPVASLALLFGALAYAMRDGSLDFRGAVAVAVLAGACLGGWGAWIRRAIRSRAGHEQEPTLG